MNKKLISLMLVMVFVLSVGLAGCSPKNETPATPDTGNAGSGDADKPVKVGVVMGALGDMGFMDESFAGLNKAKEDLGIEFDYAEIVDNSETETQLRMFADSEEYDLIMVISATYVDALKAVAPDYPDQKFSLLDATIEGFDNVHSSRVFDPEQTFLSGVIAGLVTQDERMPLANKENIIGFVGGMDNPISRSGAAGFMAGAKYVNPDVEFIYNIVGDYRDPGKAKEIAMTAYGRGADVISHNAGASGMGVFSAAQESNKYVIGSSIATADPEYSLVTSLKRIDLLIIQEIEAVIDGTWESGVSLKGIKEGAANYDRTNINTEIPQDIFDTADEIRQQYIDGKFTLPTDPDQVNEWSQNNRYTK